MKNVIQTAYQLAGIVKSRLPSIKVTGRNSMMGVVKEVDDAVEVKFNGNFFRVDLTMQVKEQDFTRSFVETPAAIQLGTLLRAKKGKSYVEEAVLERANVRHEPYGHMG